MKILLHSFLVSAAFSLSVLAAPDVPETMILDAGKLGPVTCSEWVNGTEKEIVRLDGHGNEQPAHFIWSNKAAADNRPQFGESKAPGTAGGEEVPAGRFPDDDDIPF